MVGGNCVWYLAIVVIFIGFGQAGANGCEGCIKAINWGSNASHKKRASFMKKRGVSHYIILLYCEISLSVLLSTVKCFIRYLFSLYYCFTCFVSIGIAKAKYRVKSVRIRSYSGRYFPAFRLNTERHFVYLHIQYEYGKIRTRITPNTDSFYAVKTAI